ncbi:MAG: GNAT family N-acetyltransferase [Microcoleus sp. PH2017_40_RAT_O_B]|uniref:GNAT family N-acetyltransferase n=1 Tax=unclassified Microcoleus TaxID=2642155 RepID=UPI001DC5F673|nr:MULTISPECIES: GNAT family N-acetyltransferase [unclassified Microcoleus]MCC3574084.1 GNAT family N-acetyltransferase [Microcoleus sp. PH2017_34_RAT_O_A]MCC3611550.1 GNAT family N-acetyltransferase [Microcoleus sp. PH2017_40_RAT_O_B]TAE68113.1 MAG: N-acetyltransferase [Oscillatoriales cyanobacterium]
MQQIETARLYLRQFTPDDLDDLYRIYSDAETMKYLTGVRTREATESAIHAMLQRWEEHNFGMWALVHKIDCKMIGRCGLAFLDKTPEVELGYAFDKVYWNQGLATEASFASLNYGFNILKLERIVAIARPENIASQRVIQKVGMKYEKNARYYEIDVLYYSIFRETYKSAVSS